jgi:hypothetical protein
VTFFGYVERRQRMAKFADKNGEGILRYGLRERGFRPDRYVDANGGEI